MYELVDRKSNTSVSLRYPIHKCFQPFMVSTPD